MARKNIQSADHSSRKRYMSTRASKATIMVSLLAIAPTSAVAADCIPLTNSTQCPAFSAASISTNTTLVKLYPFLEFVTTTADFDSQLATYVKTSYAQLKYQTLLGCTNVDLTNTTELYAQFTTSVICNGIIQNSKSICGLSDADSEPLCADSCASYAESEEKIIVDSAICSGVNASSSDVQSQIRADFTVCALPNDSLSQSCISGSTNEPDNCGFGNSTFGLCEYCSSTGENSTDTCCYNSDITSRCAGVVLPTITATMTFATITATVTASPTGHHGGGGLSAGAKAGIAIGSILGFLALLALVLLLIFCCRKRRASSSHGSSVFNQPTPARKGTSPNMAYSAANAAPQGYEVLPGGRIARMSALEGHTGNSPPRSNVAEAGSAVAGAAGAYAIGRARHEGRSSSSDFADSLKSDRGIGVLRPPPTARRNGSLSSNSALGSNNDHSSPNSARDMSSPHGIASQQSEQLAYFKDYYSQDEIHPGSKVSTLWAYQPRAADEFALERGDMLKVVGIWDDGWATGILVDEKADEWDEKKKAQRDSGVSNGEGKKDEESLNATDGEIKAFPLVCVCLPEHWRKTIDGDGSTESGSQGHPSTS